jgi:hypothetical protein
MMISIPPKYAVSQAVGFIKGKSAIHLARVYGERKQNYAGQNFRARGYFVSTVGRDEATIRELHPQPGKGRRAPGPDEPLEMTCQHQGGSTQSGPRQRPRSSRFERLTSESPGPADGSAGGVLT